MCNNEFNLDVLEVGSIVQATFLFIYLSFKNADSLY